MSNLTKLDNHLWIVKNNFIFIKFFLIRKRTILRIHHFPSQLSGGERSRVSIARALINRPKIILADEPSGNLDHVNAKKLIKLFKSINDEFDQSIIIATHDPNVASIGKRKLLLDNKVLSSVDSV